MSINEFLAYAETLGSNCQGDTLDLGHPHLLEKPIFLSKELHLVCEHPRDPVSLEVKIGETLCHPEVLWGDMESTPST